MIETPFTTELPVTNLDISNSNVAMIEEEVAQVKAVLQQWLGEYVAKMNNELPSEGIEVSLPQFGVESATVVRGDIGLHALVNKGGRVLAAI